ncbi:hypothetical protein GCM10027416_22030 [Okibacterium endophyticum]
MDDSKRNGTERDSRGDVSELDNLSVDTAAINIVMPTTRSVTLPGAPIHDLDDEDLLEDDQPMQPVTDARANADADADADTDPGATAGSRMDAGHEDRIDAAADRERGRADDHETAEQARSPRHSTPARGVAAVTPAPQPTPAPAPVASSTSAPSPADVRQVSALRYHTGAPELSSMLTAERLLENDARTRPVPHGFWQRLLYTVSFRRINVGDSRAVRARKELDRRISRHFDGGARFVPVLTRKGGVGKTTVTALLGMALADARDDRVIAIDANPDRGTLAERMGRASRFTVRDVVRRVDDIGGYSEFSELVARDETRLDVLASDTDPHLADAFSGDDYDAVTRLAEHYYSLVLTDCGTGIVHSVMRATLDRADAVVIVSGGSVDEARLASETLTWLESNGYEELAKNAVVVLNLATQGAHVVRLGEIESHFSSRVRKTVRVPYDPQLAAGAAISFKDLRPDTREAARRLAALVVDGIPSERAGGHP